jgi:hypothetical protein
VQILDGSRLLAIGNNVETRTMRILVVEDELDIAQFLIYHIYSTDFIELVEIAPEHLGGGDWG